LKRPRGQYAIVARVLSIVILASVQGLGSKLKSTFSAQ
jgi:Flp pilus assembly pilin Flp